VQVQQRDFRLLRRLVQTDAGAWGVLSAINNAFVNPLLISRGAGSIALGIYNSGVNVFGFGSGWVGPRLAARVGSVATTTLICLTIARILFLCVPLTLIASGSGSIPLLVASSVIRIVATFTISGRPTMPKFGIRHSTDSSARSPSGQ
jgi:hypothetical protein